MSALLKYLPDDETVKWIEDDHQMHCVEWLRQNNFLFAADQNGLRTSPRQTGKAKACGMEPGEADLRIYFGFPNTYGYTLHIEMKRWKGRRSDDQIKRHDALQALGFEVHTIAERTPAGALRALQAIISDLRMRFE